MTSFRKSFIIKKSVLIFIPKKKGLRVVNRLYIENQLHEFTKELLLVFSFEDLH